MNPTSPSNWRDLTDQLSISDWRDLELMEITIMVDNVEMFVHEGWFSTDASIDKVMLDIALARLSKV